MVPVCFPILKYLPYYYISVLLNLQILTSTILCLRYNECGLPNCGFFCVQDETTAAIEEALSVIKGWNPNWNPETFMTDNCEEEIQATERNFGGNDNLIQLYVIVSFPA